MKPERPLSDKQRRVLDAAMEVFAERGFSATSTGEIARRAGVAAGTVFRFYRTKKDLLVGVVAPLFKRFVAPQVVREFGRVLEAEYEDLEALLRAVFHDRLDWVRKHRLLVRIALQETSLHPELRELWEESVLGQLRPQVLAAVEQLQARGEVIDLPPETVARAVASLLSGFAVQRYMVEPDRDWDDEAEIEAMVGILARGLATVSTP